MTPWWAGIAGVVIGFILAWGKESYARRGKKRAHLLALRAEVELCARLADTYRSEPQMAPAYRLPELTYSNSLPRLLEDGQLTDKEVTPLIEFFNEVATLNRCLDHVHESLGDQFQLNRAVDRARLKADNLLRLFPFAWQAIESKR